MHATSPFVDTAAVEAWDAWFRWRERDGLRDLAVEATWQRVARTLATVEPVQFAADHEATLMAAFASWRLLLDERILATAGTHAASWPNNDLVAVLNAAMFVQQPFSTRAGFDLAAFRATGELAVRALDNAAALGSGLPRRKSRLRIGIIGLADALALLGVHYGSAAGCAQGGEIGRALAEGCFCGAIRSAREHGARAESSNRMLQRAVERGLPTEFLNDAWHHGLRHSQLTAITAQPRLALFANNVADALNPLSGEDSLHLVTTPEQTRSVRSSGCASAIRRVHCTGASASPPLETIASLPLSAQYAMRSAVQPWIDEPIVYLPPGVLAADATGWQLARRSPFDKGPGDPVAHIDAPLLHSDD